MGWLKTSIYTWLGILCITLYLTEKWVTWSLLITGMTAIGILDHIKRGYWRKLGIFTLEKNNFPIFGHLISAMQMKELAWTPTDKVYKEHKDKKYIGSYLFWSPGLLITDPEIVKQVTIKDFDHFVDRREFKIEGKDEYANDMLTLTKGAHWKGVRSALSPTFSSGKMKNMFPLVMAKADTLMKKLHKITGNGESTVDMKNYLGRLTVDVIGSCAFGFESNCIEDETAEFERKLAKASDQGIEIFFQFIVASISPKLADFLDMGFMARWRYFKHLCEDIVAQRKNSGTKRGDFVDLVLEAQAAEMEPGSKKRDITDNTVIASSLIFLLAGYDTVLSTLVFAAHVLAQNPEEQEKLRQEIREIVDEDGKLNYQNIMEAKYLEAVVFETQRMYPLAFILERQCTKDYILPETNIKLDKGRLVSIPVWSLQNDECYWNEPSKFNPDRFLPENKGDIVQGTFMPFGLGPRNCIAMRFALMELKIAIARLVQEFQLSLAPGREEIGIKKGPIPRPEDTMPLILSAVREE